MSEKKGYTLARIAQLTNATLVGDPDKIILGIADLDKANEDEASFLHHNQLQATKYTAKANATNAGVIFIHPDIPRQTTKNYLLHPNPTEAFQVLLELFFQGKDRKTGFEGIHPTAVIHPTAKIGKRVTIGPYTVIDEGTVIGDDTTISSGCIIGLEVIIGCDCLFHPRVTIREKSKIGNRVVLQPGVVIGSCGFGYTQTQEGNHRKLEQLGTVEIGDDVEIGANSAVDRARFSVTLIGEGTKIDNLVQIAHGVTIGKHCIIAGQTGIAGSVTIGDYVLIGGQVAIDGHLSIESFTKIAARSGVTKTLPRGVYSGAPAVPIGEHNRQVATLRKLEKMIKEIKVSIDTSRNGN